MPVLRDDLPVLHARPQPEPELTRERSTDLLIIGGGFTGLWTALLAREEHPSREIVLLEGGEIASGASGRNGGFMNESLTHGIENGLARWPEEYPTLLAMGLKNLDEIEETIRRLNIDCDYLRPGEVTLASEPYQLEELREGIEAAQRLNLELGSSRGNSCSRSSKRQCSSAG